MRSHDKAETSREKSHGTGGSDMKNAETGSAGKDGSHDAQINKEPAPEEVGAGNEENKSAATVQVEQGESGDMAERPGNEPISALADMTSRGSTKDLPGGAEGGPAPGKGQDKAAAEGGQQTEEQASLESRVASLESWRQQVQARLKHWV